MNEDKEISNSTACMLAFLVTALILYVLYVLCPDETIPSEEQKPKEQVTTEINTHEIRCVEHTGNFCVRYKVFKIIKE